jgi:phosphoglycerol transferase MdoB-like AlkP superfamily enzyme
MHTRLRWRRLWLALVTIGALALVFFIGEGTTFDRVLTDAQKVGYYAENRSLRLLAACYLLLFVAVLAALTRRMWFAIGTTAMVAGLLYGMSRTKFIYTESKLLFSDIYFHFRNLAEIEFFIGHYGDLMLYGIVALLVVATILAALWRLDDSRIPRSLGLLSVAAMILGAELLYPRLVSPVAARDVFFRAAFDERYLSSLVVSARSLTASLNAPLKLPSRTPSETTASEIELLRQAGSDHAPARRPHIILILHESSIDPAIYFNGEHYEVQKEFFASGDGSTRRLLVHTFGGRTWISEYGAMLGIDVSYLGDLSAFLGVAAVDRFQNTFADELQALGYRTIANYPSPTTFMGTGRFYPSIGFDHINTPDDMDLSITRELRPRDKAYYQFLLDDFARQRKASPSQPLFYLIWTVATHHPYVNPAFPEVRADEIVINDPAAEYARRQRIAADDLSWLRETLANRFPDEQFLLAGFGDHHPFITHAYLNNIVRPHIRPRAPGETSMMTYYRLEGIGFEPDYSALEDILEIGFLGDTLLEAAELPIGKAMAARRWLRKNCGGRWSQCAEQAVIEQANAILSSGEASLFTGR